MTRNSESLATQLRIAAEIGLQQENICRGCGAAASPDSECLVVILGKPLCHECAEQVIAEEDAEEERRNNGQFGVGA